MRHAGETCRASPNFRDRCQRHRGAHFRGSADKSYRHGVMRIQYTAVPAISPTLSPAGRKKKKEQWEWRLKGAMVVVYDKSAPRWRHHEWRDLWSFPPSSDRRQPQPATVLLAFQPSGMRRTRRTRLHDPPQGIRRRRTSVMSMSSRDFADMQTPALSWKFAAFASSRRRGEARLICEWLSLAINEQRTDNIVKFYLPVVNFLRHIALR